MAVIFLFNYKYICYYWDVVELSLVIVYKRNYYLYYQARSETRGLESVLCKVTPCPGPKLQEEAVLLLSRLRGL